MYGTPSTTQPPAVILNGSRILQSTGPSVSRPLGDMPASQRQRPLSLSGVSGKPSRLLKAKGHKTGVDIISESDDDLLPHDPYHRVASHQSGMYQPDEDTDPGLYLSYLVYHS